MDRIGDVLNQAVHYIVLSSHGVLAYEYQDVLLRFLRVRKGIKKGRINPVVRMLEQSVP